MKYLGIAERIGIRKWIGKILLKEWLERLEAMVFGPNNIPVELAESAWIDAGYAINAPDELPAGSCAGFTVQGVPDFQMAEQMTVDRVEL